MAFPPPLAYPARLDDERTLFSVRNSSESRLAAEVGPFDAEIPLQVSPDDRTDLWPDSGFATIEGEMLYHGGVLRDETGRALRLTDCARSVNGAPAVSRPAGAWVRGFVVAEHHNRVAAAATAIETFVGANFDPDPGTLDWRIRNLTELQTAGDDHDCPDVTLNWFVVENHPVRGVLARYEIAVSGGGGAFRLDFGDGDYTTNSLSGTHLYGPGASVDPVLTVKRGRCETIVTPPGRDEPAEPAPGRDEVFDIPLPEFPPIPDFNPVPPDPQPTAVTLPPIVFPCVSVEGPPGA